MMASDDAGSPQRRVPDCELPSYRSAAAGKGAVCKAGACRREPVECRSTFNLKEDTTAVQPKTLPSFEEFMSKRNRSPPSNGVINSEMVGRLKIFKEMISRTSEPSNKNLTGKNQLRKSKQKLHPLLSNSKKECNNIDIKCLECTTLNKSKINCLSRLSNLGCDLRTSIWQ